jgi:hypothetical protein
MTNPTLIRPSRWLVWATALVALSIGAAACGDDADTASTASTVVAAAEPAPVVVTATDYAYTGLPGSVPVGTALALQNDSQAEVHELVAVRLPDDETRSVEELVQLPPQELAAFFPGVATVLIAPPGETGFAVEGTGPLTEPGRYPVLCVIPTGADPQEYLEAAAAAEGGPPDVAGGPPHIVNGMYGEIVVEG